MKRAIIDNVIKLLIFAAGIIIACILVAIAFYIGRSGKAYVNSGTNQYAKMMSDYDNLDVTVYDNLEVPGQEVVTILEHMQTQNTYDVYVVTKAGSGTTTKYEKGKYYYTGTPEAGFGSGTLIQAASMRGQPSYINPVATFTGKVTRNSNGVVESITFTQK